ncbi:MAG: hypothetical protein IT580_03220 [Verrucomicrobiales bacterium]|nr:hypothetical protein [Verrucomicrobiales bacterium]
MNPQNRQRTLVVLAATALILLVGDRALVGPLARSWKARTQRLASLRLQVAQGEALLQRDHTLRERWGTMRTNTLPAEPSAAENTLLKAFDRWSQESGVGIASIRPQWKRDTKDQVTIECRTDAFGSLSSLTRFLYLLEQDPLAVRVESLELGTRDPQGQQLTLGIQVSGLVLAPGPATPSAPPKS